MSTPEVHKWVEGEGLGSAGYFGRFLKALRRNKDEGQETSTWVSLAQIDPERYSQLEAGELELPPNLEELDNWAKGWKLDREDIIYLKMAGGYDISAYVEQESPLTPELLGTAIRQLLEEQPRFPVIRFIWEVGKGFLENKFFRNNS